jgi:hypothetical protein
MKYDIVLRVVDKTSAGLKKTEQGISRVSKAGRLAKGALVGVTAAITGVVAVGATVKNTINRFDDLAKRARNVGAATEDSFKEFQALDKVLTEAGLSASETDRAFRNVNQRLLDGSKGGAAYADVFDKLGGSVLDANGDLKSSPELLKAVSTAAMNGSIDLDEFSSIVGENVGPKVFGAMQSMMKAGMSLEDALKSVKENGDFVPLGAAESAEKFNDTLGRMGEVMMSVLTQAIAPMLPVLTQLAEDILAGMPAFIDGVKGAFERMQPTLSIIGDIITGVVWPALKMLWEAFLTIQEFLQPLVETYFKLLYKGLVQIKENFNTVVETVRWFIQAIKDVGTGIEEMYTSFSEMGTNIVDGLIQGITDGFGKVKDTVVNLSDNVTGWFKEKLSIFSPSKVFEGFGMNITDGLVNGIIEGSNNIVPAMDKLAQDVEKEGSKLGENFSKTLSQGLSDGKLELSDFKDFFISTIAELATQQLAGGALGSGAGSGLGGVIASGLGGLFFADGGRIAPGKAGIVGEAGPEIVKGPATVYSNSDSRSMMKGSGDGGDNVVYSPVFNTTINPGENTSPEDASKFAQQFNSTIEAKVTDTIIKMQNRRGAFQESRPY